MDPNTNQNQPVTPIITAPGQEATPTPVTPEQAITEAPKSPEATQIPEVPQVEPTPEAPPAPESSVTPETTATPEVDQLSKVAQAPADDQDDDAQTNVQNTPAPDVAVSPDVPMDEAQPETIHEKVINEKYFAATEKVIEDFHDKPYEEEEHAEDLQIGLLKERFGKEIKKSDD